LPSAAMGTNEQWSPFFGLSTTTGHSISEKRAYLDYIEVWDSNLISGTPKGDDS